MVKVRLYGVCVFDMFMDFNGCPWISKDFVVVQWSSTDWNEFQWSSMDVHVCQTLLTIKQSGNNILPTTRKTIPNKTSLPSVSPFVNTFESLCNIFDMAEANDPH